MRPIVRDPEVLGGKPCIEGTRMSVEHILGLVATGMTASQIVAEHSFLSRLIPPGRSQDIGSLGGRVRRLALVGHGLFRITLYDAPERRFSSSAFRITI